ncbi:hypothetical protein DOV13_22975 [Salmonella enterica]|nr:hypothetical protein [Salmonella enterica]
MTTTNGRTPSRGRRSSAEDIHPSDVPRIPERSDRKRQKGEDEGETRMMADQEEPWERGQRTDVQ